MLQSLFTSPGIDMFIIIVFFPFRVGGRKGGIRVGGSTRRLCRHPPLRRIGRSSSDGHDFVHIDGIDGSSWNVAIDAVMTGNDMGICKNGVLVRYEME